MVKNIVKNTIINNELINKGEHIVLGLSGGPDSVCLFHVLYSMKDEFNLKLHAVHINHKIRPNAAEEDQEYVEKLCEAYEVPLNVFVYDVNSIAKSKGISSEDAGRQLRYGSFCQVAEKIKNQTGEAVKIAVAQNLNDQAETVLMRIIRGSSTDGIAGIDYKRKEAGKWDIIRPLLDVSRDQIEKYCLEKELKPQIDLTNLEPVYTRNKIRLELIPYIEKTLNAKALEAINRLSQNAREDKYYFEELTDDLISQYGKEIYSKNEIANSNSPLVKLSLPSELLKNSHQAVRKRLIMKAFEKVGLDKDISSVQINQAERLIMLGKTSSVTEFAKGYVLEVSYSEVLFYKKEAELIKSFEYELVLDQKIEIVEKGMYIEAKNIKKADFEAKELQKSGKENRFLCFLDYDKVIKAGGSIVVRGRREGDYIKPFGMKGTKKIQDYFVDRKIPKADRDLSPLVCIGTQVIWVCGDRINEDFKVEAETRNIMTIEIGFQL